MTRDKLEQACARMRVEREMRQARKTKRDEDAMTLAERAAENRRFRDRLRFDQSIKWDWNRVPEPRSPIPSIMPAVERACRLWGPPVRSSGVRWSYYRD